MADDTFGARLKALRGRAGLTQRQLAERAGLNQFGVAKLEQDRYSPTWPTVQALAKALGVGCAAFEGTVEPAAGAARARRRGRPPRLPAAEPPEGKSPLT